MGETAYTTDFNLLTSTVDRLLVMTGISLNQQSFVLAFMNANCLRETYILS